MRRKGIAPALGMCIAWALVHVVWAQHASPKAGNLPRELRGAIVQSMTKALDYLRQQQQPNGSWQNHPGLTSVVAASFLRSPDALPGADTERINKALAFIASFAQPDGGIYERSLAMYDYNTAVALIALIASGKSEYQPIIQKAQEFLVQSQADEKDGYEKSDKFYGGIGYGSGMRPDLSNLSFALQALKASKLPADHPVWHKALVFLQRVQNRSESNDQSWAGNDGGFVYYPGFSYAGGTNSYGSMTLSGLLSFSYVNLSKEDPRVQAALDWIRKHYTVEENPGFQNKMLYYYYMELAKALAIYKEPVLVDAQGVAHNWRQDLGQKLLQLQHPEGYWINDDPNWWMDNKVLVTAFTVIALEHILQE